MSVDKIFDLTAGVYFHFLICCPDVYNAACFSYSPTRTYQVYTQFLSNYFSSAAHSSSYSLNTAGDVARWFVVIGPTKKQSVLATWYLFSENELRTGVDRLRRSRKVSLSFRAVTITNSHCCYMCVGGKQESLYTNPTHPTPARAEVFAEEMVCSTRTSIRPPEFLISSETPG